MYMDIGLCKLLSAGDHGCLEALDYWIKLKVQVVVSLPTRVLGTNTGITAKAIWTLNHIIHKCDILWVSMFSYKKFMKLLPPWNMVLGETSQCFGAILVFASRMSSLLSLLSEGLLAYLHCHAFQRFSFFREGDGLDDCGQLPIRWGAWALVQRSNPSAPSCLLKEWRKKGTML